ncbi:MAG: alpha/beta hydrolase-fold protein [Saprospiraceae bacterium]
MKQKDLKVARTLSAVQTLTIELTTLHEKGAMPVFITGNFNGWKVNDENYRMKEEGNGRFSFTFPVEERLPQLLEYKYVRNGWENEELDEYGCLTKNRTVLKSASIVKDFVPRWRKSGIEYDPGLLPIIKIISQEIDMNEVSKKRRVSILLPHDYEHSSKKYPVLYLQDGQNLFNDYAPFGNWSVNKRMAVLAEKNHHEVIVVAIDHGGKDRIKEFLPYEGTKLGTVEGKIYAHWIVETLKPHIDAHYRTLSDATHTGIGGSSMGGLISIYAALIYPHVFSKMMIFSPSLWVASKVFFDAIHFTHPDPTKVYLYAGGREGTQMVPNVQRFKAALEKLGFNDSPVEFKLVIDPKGEHNEERWGREFPRALEWLYYH